MKCYYIMIRWDGPYVTGFVIPRADNEEQALSMLKKILWARLQLQKQREPRADSYEFSIKNIKAYMRSLKRPWRKNRDSPVVKITELSLPLIAGYWLEGVVDGKYCNTPATWEPRPKS